MSNRGIGSLVANRLYLMCGLCGDTTEVTGKNTAERIDAARAQGWRATDSFGWVCPRNSHKNRLKGERKHLQSVAEWQGDPSDG